MESLLLVGTTDAAGALVVTQKIYHPRRLVSVKWLAGNFSDDVDATLINVGLPAAENALGLAAGTLNTTVATLTDANDDATYTANAIIDNTIRLTVSSGGDTKTGGCICYFDETASSSAGGGGDASAANQATQITAIGSLTETAPASDTASSGLNGRAQRIAQRLTSLIALIPTSLGQKAKTASMAVTLASDEDLLATAGAVADAAVTAGATGSISAKLRSISRDLIANLGIATIAVPPTVYNGKTMVTTAGTRVVLASSQAILSGVTIKALAANTGTIYVGSSTVASTNGYALTAGQTVFLAIANLNTVNIDASVTGTEGVTYIAT